MSFTMSGLEDRNQTLAFQWNDVISFIFGRISGACHIDTSSHDVHHMSDFGSRLADILLDTFWPVGNHWSTDTSFIRFGFPKTERCVGYVCPACSQ